MQITRVQTMPNGRTKYVAEVSDVSPIPGLWPVSFVWHSQSFKRTVSKLDQENELISVSYVAQSGDLIIVYND